MTDLTQTNLMTVEQFWERYVNTAHELIAGEIVEVGNSGILQSAVAAKIIAALIPFVTEHHLGLVTTADGAYYLSPYDLVAPDAAFISREKVGQLENIEKYAPFAPDFAVEVVAPTNTADEIRSKVNRYLAAGTKLVWVAYPRMQQVDAYYADGSSRSFKMGDMLDGGEALPGFKLAVKDIFPER